MILSCSINFWSDDVGCFCHEAITRSFHRNFEDFTLGENDLAHEKYIAASEFDPKLKNAAWFEYLRNGPSHTFSLPPGITGKFSRYRIEFKIPDDSSVDDVLKIQSFLNGLKLGAVNIED